MKKGKLQNLSLTFLLIGILGCGGVSQNEHDNLKAENEKLRKELEDLKKAAFYLERKIKNLEK